MNLTKTLTFLTLLLLAGAVKLSAAIVYVDWNATGANDGTSWFDAYNDLQDALTNPNTLSGDEIWVAQGTYYADPTDQTVSFELNPPGVDLAGIYGGFEAAALPTMHCEANPQLFPTILSGEITGTPTKTDNTERIVLVNSLNAPMIIDGLMIEDGFADGIGASSQGAGIHYEGQSGDFLTVRRCVLLRNHADADGGGIYLGPFSNFELVEACNDNSYFAENDAMRGGAIFFDDGTSAFLIGSEFEENVAVQGGAHYYFQCGFIDQTNLLFTLNTADDGGAIYDDNSPSVNSGLCTFNYNVANDNGGAIYSNTSHWNMSDMNFEGNQATNGGAIYAEYGDMHIGGGPSSFTSNSSIDDGGAIYFNDMMQAHISMTDFSLNAADLNGGAIYANLGSLDIIECEFEQNHALNDGGGVHSDMTFLQMVECNFARHTARHGGAVYANDGMAHINGPNNFDRNVATGNGGAICMVDVVNGMSIEGTFNANRSKEGGAVHLMNSPGNIGYSTFFRNSVTDFGGAVALLSCNPVDFTQCDLNTNGTPLTVGKSGGNLYADNSVVTATDCAFSFGGSYDGAGIWLNESDWHSNNCEFEGNAATGAGGAIYADESTLLLEADNFSSNSGNGGGAIYLEALCSVVMRDGLAFDNSSSLHGGFILNEQSSDVKIGNLYAIANTAGKQGGLFASRASDAHFYVANMSATCNYSNAANIYHGASSLADFKLYFSSFLDNTHPDGFSHSFGRTMIEGAGTNSIVANSVFWKNQQIGFCGGITVEYTNTDANYDCSGPILPPVWPGTGNIASTPRFVNELGPDNIACTSDDDLRLQKLGGPISPCINAGSSSTVHHPADFADVDYDSDDTEPLPLDILGADRLYGSNPDMGAYENDDTYKQGETPEWSALSESLVFPNPATDMVNVISGNTIQQVSVFNLNGQLIDAEVTISHDLTTVDLSNLNAGVYFLRVTDAEGSSTHQVQKL